MFQKLSTSVPSDSSGILLVRIIQTRRCSHRRHAKIGKFLLTTIRHTVPELLKKRKKKTRAIVIRTKHFHKRNDGLTYSFSDNALVLLKKRMNTVGKELYGPTSLALKIKKFRIAFGLVF